MMPSLRERVRGAVLAAAVGDAMGHPTEFITSFADLYARFGPAGVTGYECYWTRDGKRFAPYTDDTQLSEATLRVVLQSYCQNHDLDSTMRELARAYIAWAQQPQGGHRAPGRACLLGCRALAAGASWDRAGADDAGGCGSVMRVYPFGLLYAHDLQRAEDWAVAHSRLTHGAPIALAACAGMSVAVAQGLRGAQLSVMVDSMIAAAARHDLGTAHMIEQARSDARAGVAPQITLQRLQGWAAHEAIAAATYVALRHEHDLPAGILEAANTPGDSDSIATLVGTLLGVTLGVTALPAAWLADLERSDELQLLADSTAAALG